MAPRRVADDLIEAEDTRDLVRDREDQLLANERGEDDQIEDDQQDDQVEDDQQDDQVEDDQPDTRQADDRQAPRRRERAPSAIEERLTAAERRAEEAERRAVEAQARYEAMSQVRQQAPAESVEQEAARLALMTPEQIIDYKVDKALRNHNQTIAQATFAATNAADKASFETLAAGNPQLKRIAMEVETKHADIVRQSRGAPVPDRTTVAKYLLGEKALALALRAQPEQQARTRRVEQQRTRPGSARSDVAPARRGGQTLEQRLENMAL